MTGAVVALEGLRPSRRTGGFQGRLHPGQIAGHRAGYARAVCDRADCKYTRGGFRVRTAYSGSGPEVLPLNGTEPNTNRQP